MGKLDDCIKLIAGTAEARSSAIIMGLFLVSSPLVGLEA